MERILPQIISPDQTGFIRRRSSAANVRKLLNMIHTLPGLSPEIVLSLDAEKAFDRVEWEFLFVTLKKFGFGDGFISWIKLIYSTPVATVITNGQQSEYFSLSRGTRQGCPLSPLLFAIAVEPLAIALRQADGFHGIERGGSQHKLSLYGDDLLLYVSDPNSSLPFIIDVLNQFGKLSGYKINLSKSVLFPLKHEDTLNTFDTFPFKIAQTSFKYLGVEVTRNLPTLFTKNFTALLEKCKADFDRWKDLPLSVSGRVNIIKMIVLPKFIYLFQNIPIFIKKSFFKSFDKLISTFIWKCGPHRIKRAALQRQKNKAGLALLNFIYYYWACNIQKVLHWVHFDRDQCDSWLTIEYTTSHLHLGSLVCAALAPMTIQSNIIVITAKIWAQFRRHFGLTNISIYSPIWENHNCPPASFDASFQTWHTKGIKLWLNLFAKGRFLQFSELSETFSLSKSNFFRYLQIKNFVQKNWQICTQMLTPHPLVVRPHQTS